MSIRNNRLKNSLIFVHYTELIFVHYTEFYYKNGEICREINHDEGWKVCAQALKMVEKKVGKTPLKWNIRRNKIDKEWIIYYNTHCFVVEALTDKIRKVNYFICFDDNISYSK